MNACAPLHVVRPSNRAIFAGLAWCVLWLALVGLLAQPAAAQRRAKSEGFKPGDRVEVNWAGKWQPGEVVEINPNGWVKVRLLESPIEMTPVLPPDWVRLTQTGTSKTPGKAPAGATQPLEARIWTDSTGKYKVGATLMEFKDGQVTLQRLDGQTVKIPLEKLSQADQEYVKSAGAAPAPAAGAAESPFGTATAGTAAGGTAPGSIEVMLPDWSSAREIVPGQPAPAWSLQPYPAPAVSGLVTQPIPLRGPKGEFFESAKAAAFSASAGLAVVSHVNGHPGQGNKTRFELCDLRKGAALESVPMPEEMVPLDFSLDGKQLLARTSAFGFGKNDRLDVWSVAGTKLQQVASWKPYEGEKGLDRDIAWAAWVDDGRVLTTNRSGKLALWEVAGAKPVWWLKLVDRCRPALSPGGKYLAVVTSGGLEFYDPPSGQILGRLTDETLSGPALGFRADGSQLALLSGRRLQVWDLLKGQKYRDVFVPAAGLDSRVDWTSDNCVLVDCAYLADVERRIVLWEYRASDAREKEAAGVLGGYYWYVATDRTSQAQRLVPVALPHDEARKAAEGLDPEAILAVKPGASVSLRIDIEGTPEQREAVRQSLVQKLQEAGLKIADNQPVVLIARTGYGEKEEISYRSFGTPPWGKHDTVSVTQRTCEVEFQVNGQTAWLDRIVIGAPHMLHLEKDQTVEQAVAEAVKPNLNFFNTVWIPGHVIRPSEKTPRGASTLTIRGPVRAMPSEKQPAAPKQRTAQAPVAQGVSRA